MSSTKLNQYTQIHKFGGKGLIDVNAFNNVKQRLDTSKPQLVIISALAKTTAKLQEILELAITGEHHQKFKKLIEFHQDLAENLLGSSKGFDDYSSSMIDSLNSLFDSVATLASYDVITQDYVLSIGEHWSTFLFSTFLDDDVAILDSSKILVIEKNFGQIKVDWLESQTRLTKFFQVNNSKHILITGYIACNEQNQTLTLGFEGSDFSAAIFAKLFQVRSIHIWTDVDGLYTADPHLVKQAKVIKQLSYNEAIELASMGASLIHPQTILPAMELNIPIYIANAFRESISSSVILKKAKPCKSLARGISSINKVSLINIEGNGVLVKAGLAAKVFDILQSSFIEILLISQASSQHSLCFVLHESQVKLATEKLKDGLALEIQTNQVQSILSKGSCAILTIVGDKMAGQPGVCAQLFSCLAKANINIVAVSQGSSERNISIVINDIQRLKALNIIHAGLGLSKKQLQIALIGPGNVGQVFFKQLIDNKARIEEQLKVNLNLKAICSSKKMLLEDFQVDNAGYLQSLKNNGDSLNYTTLINYLKETDFSHTVVIDCSASEDVVNQYQAFLESDFHIITPNKKASSGPLERFNKIKKTCDNKHRHFLYETNVCAGLPVIKTLQDLVATGDVINQIKGVFSGTLSYLFNEFSSGVPFSKALATAYKLGLTEPDPRDDLNGVDVARKCICLARELGFSLELDDVDIVPILPNKLMTGTVDDFMARGQQIDEFFSKQAESLIKTSNKLVYSGTINHQGKICLAIEEVNSSSAFFNLKGTDNMVIYKTARYQDYPLIIQGPGAGADVTAAGVFADLLRLVDLTTGRL